MEQTEQQVNVNGQLTAEDVDVELLPLIYDILRGVERESTEASQKPRDSQDTSSSKVIELQKKLTQIREQIQKLPGIEYNRADQLKQLDTLRKQLRLKRELLLKYRNMCSSFEMPKA